eukprot:5017691-Amphidinium_carterae.1
MSVRRRNPSSQAGRKDAEGGTLRNNKDVAMGEVDDITSLSTDCLTEQPSSSNEDDFTWESLAP